MGDNIQNKIDILGLAEVRWKGAGEFTSDGYKMLYSGGDQHHRGVGIMLSPDLAKTIKGYWPVSDRIMVTTLNAKPFDISIIQVYAPTADHDDTEIETFYEEIDKTMKQLKSTDIKIVMGDFNAKVGEGRIGNIIGPHGLGEINESGERLVEWCAENEFVVTNTWFKNHARRKWTWKSPGDRQRNQIDYIMIQSRFRNAIRSAKSMPGADCGSDHVPVICTFNLKLKAIKRTKHQPCYNFRLLQTNKELKEKFAVEVNNKFTALEVVTEVEHQWEQMKDSISKTIEENIPLKPKKEHKKWMTQEILDHMESRREAKNDPTKYKLIDKEIKKKCNEAKEAWLNEQCEEIENAKVTDSKYMHNKINDISNKKASSQNNCIKSKDGKILMNKADILKRWTEYIEELFYDDRGDQLEITKPMEGPPILESEVEKAIKEMNKGKAIGPDLIPVEAYEALDEKGIKKLTTLVNNIYDTGNIPNDMLTSTFITLPKKPGTTDCECHRTISLMSHTLKLLLKILMARIRNKIQPEISETQFGFVKDKGTTNAIFTMTMLTERCIEMQKDLYLCFIDYSKAFDKVRHEDLFNILNKLDIDGKDLRILSNLYWRQTATVKIDGEHSEETPIRRGVRQGCILSPDLFNLYSENILREIENIQGISLGGRNINNLRYADDTVLIAQSEQSLQDMLDTVVEASENKGLALNISKTECMTISKTPQAPICNLQSNGKKVKQVNRFKYLGYSLTSDGRCTSEVQKRIATAKVTFKKLSTIMTNRNIKMNTKYRILKAYVWSTLLYGCECWTITNSIKMKLEAAEMWFMRRILKVSWTERKSNQEVLEMAGQKRSLMNTIRKRQMKFMGHIYRKNALEHLGITGKVEGKRSRGRQRVTYVDSLNRWATSGKMNNNQFMTASYDRVGWKIMAANACSRPDT